MSRVTCKPSPRPMCWPGERKGSRCSTRSPILRSSSCANWCAEVWKSSSRNRPARSPEALIADLDEFYSSLRRDGRGVMGRSLSRFIVSNLLRRLVPVLNGSAVLAASLFVEFVGASGDLRRQVDRLPGHGIGNAPPDHQDLNGVIHAQAGDQS